MRGRAVLLVFGVLLILAGIAAFAYGSVTVTDREKVLDLGPIEATKEEERAIPLPPLLAGAAIAGGALLVVVGMRRRP